MTERFKKAYDSLVRAYFEGTLAKSTCLACACGNIIFGAMGEPLTKDELDAEIENLGFPYSGRRSNNWYKKRDIILKEMGGIEFKPRAIQKGVINEAGYTTEEFVAIESAFELNTHISFTEYPSTMEQDILEDQYNGLCAVVDVLIHLDKEKEENADTLKGKFREHPKLQTIVS